MSFVAAGGGGRRGGGASAKGARPAESSRGRRLSRRVGPCAGRSRSRPPASTRASPRRSSPSPAPAARRPVADFTRQIFASLGYRAAEPRHARRRHVRRRRLRLADDARSDHAARDARPARARGTSRISPWRPPRTASTSAASTASGWRRRASPISAATISTITRRRRPISAAKLRLFDDAAAATRRRRSSMPTATCADVFAGGGRSRGLSCSPTGERGETLRLVGSASARLRPAARDRGLSGETFAATSRSPASSRSRTPSSRPASRWPSEGEARVAEILRGLAGLEGVPGRLERIGDVRGRSVFVDYAHKPDALAHVLDALRPFTPRTARRACSAAAATATGASARSWARSPSRRPTW